MSEFTCFKCGDGNTPLYCLNCANEMSKSELALVTGYVASPETWDAAIKFCATKSVQESAQLAAEEIMEWASKCGGGLYQTRKTRTDKANEIILLHLAPHCGVL